MDISFGPVSLLQLRMSLVHHYLGVVTSKGQESLAVLVGSDIAIKCSTNESDKAIRWNYYTPRSQNVVYLYNGYQLLDNFTNRYDVKWDESRHLSTLYIDNLQLSDGGKYQCSEVGRAKFNSSFHVFALGKVSIRCDDET